MTFPAEAKRNIWRDLPKELQWRLWEVQSQVYLEEGKEAICLRVIVNVCAQAQMKKRERVALIWPA